GGRPAPVGALLRPPGGVRARQVARRLAACRRRGGRGPVGLPQLLPGGSAFPTPERPRRPVAGAGHAHRPQGLPATPCPAGAEARRQPRPPGAAPRRPPPPPPPR